MKARGIWFLLGIAATVITPWIFQAVLSCIEPNLPLAYTNEIITTSQSLDGRWQAVVFAGHGGAAAADFVEVSVLKSGAKLNPSEGGNVFRLRAPLIAGNPPVIKVAWDEDGRLLIHYDKNQIVAFAQNCYGGGPVFYRHIQ